MIDAIISPPHFNEPELLIWRGRGPRRHKRATVRPKKGGGCFLQACQRRGRTEKRRAPPRLTLKSLRASVCSASEGSVVRGERSPSLQKLKASLLHKADSGKRTTHTHTHVRTEFQMTQQLRQLHTCCSRRKHSLQAGLKLSEDQNNTKLLLGELRDDEITHAHTRTHTVFLLLQ